MLPRGLLQWTCTILQISTSGEFCGSKYQTIRIIFKQSVLNIRQFFGTSGKDCSIATVRIERFAFYHNSRRFHCHVVCCVQYRFGFQCTNKFIHQRQSIIGRRDFPLLQFGVFFFHLVRFYKWKFTDGFLVYIINIKCGVYVNVVSQFVRFNMFSVQ